MPVRPIKIGTRGMRKDLQFCCQYLICMMQERWKNRPKCNITKNNIKTNFCLNPGNYGKLRGNRCNLYRGITMNNYKGKNEQKLEAP